METLITSGVEVTVETFYQPEYSNPAGGEHMFAYRITISNHNLYTVQLLKRKWFITDAMRGTEVVEGDGVVGRQPVLYAGDSYQYTSGCPFKTTIGKMEGHYTFENKSTNQLFEVAIPAFTMTVPDVLN